MKKANSFLLKIIKEIEDFHGRGLEPGSGARFFFGLSGLEKKIWILIRYESVRVGHHAYVCVNTR